MIRWITQEESGQGMVEYALILALVAIVAIAVLSIMGSKIKNKFQEVSNALS